MVDLLVHLGQVGVLALRNPYDLRVPIVRIVEITEEDVESTILEDDYELV